jgi:hypothetical protein
VRAITTAAASALRGIHQSGLGTTYHLILDWAGQRTDQIVFSILLLNPKSKTCGEQRRTVKNLNSPDDLIRSRQHIRRNRQSDLFGCLEVDDQLKLRRLLHRQISRLGTLQDFVHVNTRAPKLVSGVRPVEHEAAEIDILLVRVNGRQPVFAGKLDDPLSSAKNWRLVVVIIAPTCFCFAV